MFYLLEDNRIIDSENLPKNVKIEKIAKDDKDNAFFIQIQYLDFLKTRKIGYIKKQSENVYDLIDWNEDLIKVNDNIYECRVLPNWRLTILLENNYLVDAIYKPDANGNYIKAWEKKNGSI
ncbi:MAG: hypothetical protein IKT40_03385 [Bacilli bacterium]|nr:hypothetical protein [Bacilli bacterium]